MFGILYTLLGIGKATHDAIRYADFNSDAWQRAADNHELAYMDAKGNHYLLSTNEQVMFRIDPLTKDAGWRVIQPKSKNYGKFYNESAHERFLQWEKLHKEVRDGKTPIDDDGYAITAIPWEQLRNDIDNEYVKIEGTMKTNRPRPCEGVRFRDIDNGRLYVERTASLNRNLIFYVDVETGLIVRLSDNGIKRNAKAYNRSEKEWIDRCIKDYNERKQKELEAGLKETDPAKFFSNHLQVRY